MTVDSTYGGPTSVLPNSTNPFGFYTRLADDFTVPNGVIWDITGYF